MTVFLNDKFCWINKWNLRTWYLNKSQWESNIKNNNNIFIQTTKKPFNPWLLFIIMCSNIPQMELKLKVRIFDSNNVTSFLIKCIVFPQFRLYCLIRGAKLPFSLSLSHTHTHSLTLSLCQIVKVLHTLSNAARNKATAKWVVLALALKMNNPIFTAFVLLRQSTLLGFICVLISQKTQSFSLKLIIQHNKKADKTLTIISTLKVNIIIYCLVRINSLNGRKLPLNRTEII